MTEDAAMDFVARYNRADPDESDRRVFRRIKGEIAALSPSGLVRTMTAPTVQGTVWDHLRAAMAAEVFDQRFTLR